MVSVCVCVLFVCLFVLVPGPWSLCVGPWFLVGLVWGLAWRLFVSFLTLLTALQRDASILTVVLQLVLVCEVTSETGLSSPLAVAVAVGQPTKGK